MDTHCDEIIGCRKKSTNHKRYDLVFSGKFLNDFPICILSTVYLIEVQHAESVLRRLAGLWAVCQHFFMHVAYEEVVKYIHYCPFLPTWLLSTKRGQFFQITLSPDLAAVAKRHFFYINAHYFNILALP